MTAATSTGPPNNRHQGIKKAVASLAGTARSTRFEFQVDAGFPKLALSANAAPRGLRCISRPYTIPLIKPPSSTSENHSPNRASGPNFHHHIFKLFGADSRAERTRRARRGAQQQRFGSSVRERPARCESESHTKRSVSDLARSGSRSSPTRSRRVLFRRTGRRDRTA